MTLVLPSCFVTCVPVVDPLIYCPLTPHHGVWYERQDEDVTRNQDAIKSMPTDLRLQWLSGLIRQIQENESYKFYCDVMSALRECGLLDRWEDLSSKDDRWMKRRYRIFGFKPVIVEDYWFARQDDWACSVLRELGARPPLEVSL